ncbi:asparaginase domain-containing protein [uncultured Aquimarina sp.]|uniref:asparaginase domain-containing protein n=1 Tax=uncultured Aquimarina sp. TaxID=575652 RepID=UPI0026117AC3|nr:asparaginase domain-containing protein [uncultured Aquimarina sp.]
MIHIITTGGTIGGRDLNQNEEKADNSQVNIASFLENANVSFKYHIDQVFDKDSRLIDENDRELISKKVMRSEQDKILITHGTFTMDKTAKYLGELNINKTIVLVGSFVLGNNLHTDAPFNLGFAFSSLNFLNKGVYIVMNGAIFGWKNVHKNIEKNRFESLT